MTTRVLTPQVHLTTARSWSGGRCLTGVGYGRRRASTAPSLAATKAHGEHEDGEEDLCAEAGQGCAAIASWWWPSARPEHVHTCMQICIMPTACTNDHANTSDKHSSNTSSSCTSSVSFSAGAPEPGHERCKLRHPRRRVPTCRATTAKGMTRLNTALSPGCRSEHSVNEDSSN